ncbi:Alpha-crystallin A chain [Halotydeus destructor]|nr:Alpha-crystallin A chain [Halotydeus destructor]
MSLTRPVMPRILGPDYFDMFHFPDRLLGQDFGGHLELFEPIQALPRQRHHHGLMDISRQLSEEVDDLKKQSAGTLMVKDEGDKFQVNLDVSHFKPEELTVTQSPDGFLIIKGQHKERTDDHGFISREFTRRYLLPKDVEMDMMACSLSPSGVLGVSAPKRAQHSELALHDRNVPIMVAQHQGQQPLKGCLVHKKPNGQSEKQRG